MWLAAGYIDMGANFRKFEFFSFSEKPITFLGPGVGKKDDMAKFINVDDGCHTPKKAPGGVAVRETPNGALTFYFETEGIFKLCFMFAEERKENLWREYSKYLANVEPGNLQPITLYLPMQNVSLVCTL